MASRSPANMNGPRASPNPVDAAVLALQHTSLSDRMGGPPLPPPSQPHPGAGMAPGAGRRLKPGLKLSDIPGGGGLSPQGAGLGAGRPALPPQNGAPPRRPGSELGTPFANFRKIVYVFFTHI